MLSDQLAKLVSITPFSFHQSNRTILQLISGRKLLNLCIIIISKRRPLDTQWNVAFLTPIDRCPPTAISTQVSSYLLQCYTLPWGIPISFPFAIHTISPTASVYPLMTSRRCTSRTQARISTNTTWHDVASGGLEGYSTSQTLRSIEGRVVDREVLASNRPMTSSVQ